ncbi:hypothetical protein ACHOLT_06030 [Desulfitobacterium sp. Sab5]|uniref:hypothetical protein n=1 Tax=Desulfitobacterium nosdiversum TaxID=3375356 RepID=UPI003CF051E1
MIFFVTPTMPEILGNVPVRGAYVVLLAELHLSCTWANWWRPLSSVGHQGRTTNPS